MFRCAMDFKYGVAAIILVCLVVLLIGILKKRAAIVLNFVVRAVVGMICIYFINQLLAKQGISVEVGMNLLSILTSGVLGISGVIMLYGIMFLQFL